MPASFTTRKRFGQHFLIDRTAVRRIVETLAPRPDDAVLEIGPGDGALTSALIERTGSIAAVELDRGLVESLRQRFPPERLLLYPQDVLGLDLAGVLRALGPGRSPRLTVAGNLPYNISKPVAMLMVDQRALIERAVLMFQREVAQRLTASCGEREYGPLGILAGLVYEVRLEFDLPPAAFRPRPAVVSSVTRWIRRPHSPIDRDDSAVRRCLRASFASPRRTLFNNLRATLGSAPDAEALLRASGLDGRLRPAKIPPEGYLRLAEHWPAGSAGDRPPRTRRSRS